MWNKFRSINYEALILDSLLDDESFIIGNKENESKAIRVIQMLKNKFSLLLC